jgi:hypothetical protein
MKVSTLFVFTDSFEAEMDKLLPDNSNNDSFSSVCVCCCCSFISSFYRGSFSKPFGRCEKMAHARISMYMPPDIDPTKAAIAYGCRALSKLNEELQSRDLLTRQKALVALCDLMHDPEYVYEAINIGESIPHPVTMAGGGGGGRG